MSAVYRVGQGRDVEAKCTKGIVRVAQQSEAKVGKSLLMFDYLLKVDHKGKLSQTSPRRPPYFLEVTAR